MGTCASMTVAENMTMALNKGKPYGLKWGLKKAYKKDFTQRLKMLNMNIEDKTDALCGTAFRWPKAGTGTTNVNNYHAGSSFAG